MSDERYHKPDCESLVCLRCLPPLAVLNDPAYIELRTALTASQDRVRAIEDENVRLRAEVAREHELFLIAHRDNIKGAALLADAVKRREVAESEVERLKAEKDYDGKEVLAAHVAALTKELDIIRSILEDGLDRGKDPRVLVQALASIAVNSLYRARRRVNELESRKTVNLHEGDRE